LFCYNEFDLLIIKAIISLKTLLNKMGIELVLLMNCVALVWGQSTISGLNDAGLQSNYIEDVKSELDAIRQLIGAQQIAAVCNDRQTIQELKSEIQDIRQSLSNQSHLLETLLHKWHGIGMF